MNQKFFASLTGKYLRVLALLFVLFGAAQHMSAQSLVSPTIGADRLKSQSYILSQQISDTKGTDTQLGLLKLRLAYFGIVSERLDGTITTQEAIDKSALVLAERYSKLPDTNVSLTTGHVQTVMSETTTLLSN